MAVGREPPRYLYSRFERLSVILHWPRLTGMICWRGAEDALPAARRFTLALRTDETHFFCSVADNGSAIVDEIFEAVDGLSGVRLCALRDKRPSAVAGGSRETSGRRTCVPQAQASLMLARDRRCRSRADARLRPSARRASADGSTEFQVHSSNRFSAPAEVALPSAGHTQPEAREARYPVHTAERLFVLSTRPAVGLPRPQLISSLMRARRPRGSVASDLRGT